MNSDLKNFVKSMTQVITATLFGVFTVAFISVPYVMQQHPGDACVPSPQADLRHMT